MTKFPQLYFEAKTYKYLNSSGNVVGIPKVIFSVKSGSRDNNWRKVQHNADGFTWQEFVGSFCWPKQEALAKDSLDDRRANDRPYRTFALASNSSSWYQTRQFPNGRRQKRPHPLHRRLRPIKKVHQGQYFLYLSNKTSTSPTNKASNSQVPHAMPLSIPT